MMKTAYIHAPGGDVFENQALEKYLLETVGPQAVTLYLWQNRSAVVIGANQNAWRECRVAELEAAGGQLARRISGGGAVYHDRGNLNFTFILRREHYDIARQQGVICAALRSLGIAAELTGRNDIAVQGRKVSGNAFYEGRHCLHHGTLLISVDQEALSRFLQVSAAKLQAKGVASVRSRVANLSEFQPGLDSDIMANALLEAFAAEYGGKPELLEYSSLDQARLAELRDEFAGAKWRLQRPIPCDVSMEQRFNWGGIEIRLHVEAGRVAETQIHTDSLDIDLAGALRQAFLGRDFNAQVLADAAQSAAIDAGMARDIAGMLRQQGF